MTPQDVDKAIDHTLFFAVVFIGTGLALLAVMGGMIYLEGQSRQANITKVEEVVAASGVSPLCMNASEDLWVDLTAAGFPSKIAAGNLTVPASTWNDVDHVWVITEVYPGREVIIEATRARFVWSDLAPYYEPYAVFDNPQEMWRTYYQVTGDEKT